MLLSAALLLLIVSVLTVDSWQAIRQIGWGIFSRSWHPPDGQYGMLSMMYGSTVVTLIALTFAVPLGLLAAIFTSEILPVRYRLYTKATLEILAGIPSIVYGLIGVAFLSVWIGDIFDLPSGRTLLTAGILISIMVLPTIISLSDDALHNVPARYREAAKGLGLYKYEIIRDAVLPIAKRDLMGAVLLALGRVLGETMAVMLVIGSIDRIPQPVFDFLMPGQTITSKLGREIAESAFGSLHFSALIFMGLLLLLAVVVMTGVVQHYVTNGQRLYE